MGNILLRGVADQLNQNESRLRDLHRVLEHVAHDAVLATIKDAAESQACLRDCVFEELEKQKKNDVGHERYRLRWLDDQYIDEGNLHSDPLVAASVARQISEGSLYCQSLILDELHDGKWEPIDSLGLITITNGTGEIEERIRYEHEMLRNNLLAATS